MQKEQQREETKITNYSVFIQTRINKKFVNFPDSNLEDQNRQMTDFIFSKINIQYANFKEGFLYNCNNFSDIDNILNVMFKVLHAKSRLDYAICIQVGYDIKKMVKLAELNHYGKIVAAADTVYRYGFNKNQRYKTEMIGVYQQNEDTIEVYEFKEKEII